MITKRTYNNLTWIDLASPTNKDISTLMKDVSLHPRIAAELIAPTLKPRLEVYDDVAYLILHFPTIRYTHSNEFNQEVDFIISRDTLITTHYDTVASIDAFAKEFEVATILSTDQHNHQGPEHAGHIFYRLIRKLYHAIQQELDGIEQRVNTIEESVFSGREQRMVKTISDTAKDLLDMQQSIEGHEQTLKELLGLSGTLFEKSFAHQLQDILHDFHTVEKRVRNQREFLNELRTTNDSLLSTKQNEIMKTLTIMAFVTFPLTLVGTVFGMNTANLPFVGHPADFWIVIGIMVALTILMFAYFKHKKWL